MTDRPLIAITLGDPSGVGPEVVVKALVDPTLHEAARLFVIGAVETLRAAVAQTGGTAGVRAIAAPQDAASSATTIDVLEVADAPTSGFPLGQLSDNSARASHAWVETAARLAIDGTVDAISTAPVNKSAWRAAGFEDTGHQEVFKRLTGSTYVATMLVSGQLRCMHLSTHLSLSEACDYVTRENVLRAIRVTHEHFTRWGFQNPGIGVAALNPHGSDGGPTPTKRSRLVIGPPSTLSGCATRASRTPRTCQNRRYLPKRSPTTCGQHSSKLRTC